MIHIRFLAYLLAFIKIVYFLIKYACRNGNSSLYKHIKFCTKCAKMDFQFFQINIVDNSFITKYLRKQKLNIACGTNARHWARKDDLKDWKLARSDMKDTVQPHGLPTTHIYGFFNRLLPYINVHLLPTVIHVASPCSSDTIVAHDCCLIKRKRRSCKFPETAACRYKCWRKLAAQTTENSGKQPPPR